MQARRQVTDSRGRRSGCADDRLRAGVLLWKGGLIVSAVDKMKNKAQEMTGQGKEHVGKATGDESLEAEGNKDQASGNVKQAGEKVKDVFK